ncbi:MAG TPA: G5 domain-containing protein [Candidatus Saccharimonadales bacterium]|nr:G5 domain-containing protein [Candidatus Saccharimonadales bacterium]
MFRRIVSHPLFIIPTATFAGLLILTIAGFLSVNQGSPTFRPTNTRIVIVSHDGQEQTVPTRAPTVGVLLSRLHIVLRTGDVVEPGLATPIVQQNFRVNVYRAVPVEIIEGMQHTFTYSAAATPRAIVAQSGITIYPEDDVSVLPTQNFLTDDAIGERVVINPATPVNVNLFGTPVVMRTHALSIAELMKSKGIKLGSSDSVQPAMTTPITANLQVFFIHKGTQIVTVSQPIPMPVQTVQDSSLSFGTNVIRQQGSPGTELITYQEQLQNGQSVGRTEIQHIITVQPVPEIVAVGQTVQIPSDQEAVMSLAGIPSGDFAYVSFIVSHESGWCPTKVQGEYGDCPGTPPASLSNYAGYGLGQATPGYKMSPYGSDWETNPVTQLKWANGYAVKTYGSWAAAYNHWQAHSNW